MGAEGRGESQHSLGIITQISLYSRHVDSCAFDPERRKKAEAKTELMETLVDFRTGGTLHWQPLPSPFSLQLKSTDCTEFFNVVS